MPNNLKRSAPFQPQSHNLSGKSRRCCECQIVSDVHLWCPDPHLSSPEGPRLVLCAKDGMNTFMMQVWTNINSASQENRNNPWHPEIKAMRSPQPTKTRQHEAALPWNDTFYTIITVIIDMKSYGNIVFMTQNVSKLEYLKALLWKGTREIWRRIWIMKNLAQKTDTNNFLFWFSSQSGRRGPWSRRDLFSQPMTAAFFCTRLIL